LEYFVQLVVIGFATGGLYAVIAIGFVLIYKATEVLNFAQGELLLVGAYFFYTLNASMNLHFIISFLSTLIFCALFGLILERLVLRPMIGEPPFSIVMITFGLSILIRSVVVIVWGAENRIYPHFFSKEPISLFGTYLPSIYFDLTGISVIFFVAIFFFIKFSKWGLAMRATANNQSAASIMGINIKNIFGLAWAVSSVVAAVGGIFFGYINVISPYIGVIGLNLFPAVVVGGLDSILGAIIGGLSIGIIENLAGGYLGEFLGGGLKVIAPFVVLIFVLMIKPYGLFGKKELERV